MRPAPLAAYRCNVLSSTVAEAGLTDFAARQVGFEEVISLKKVLMSLFPTGHRLLGWISSRQPKSVQQDCRNRLQRWQDSQFLRLHARKLGLADSCGRKY